MSILILIVNHLNAKEANRGDELVESETCATETERTRPLGVCQRAHGKTVLYLYSEVTMLAIRLPQSIEKRLEKLARRTGRTKTYYVREAIVEHLEDLEDRYLAERALERVKRGEERTIPLK